MKEGNLSMFTCVALFVCDVDEASAGAQNGIRRPQGKGGDRMGHTDYVLMDSLFELSGTK